MENGLGTLAVKRPPKLVSAGARGTDPKSKVTILLSTVLSILSKSVLPVVACLLSPSSPSRLESELDSSSASHHLIRVVPGGGTGGGGTPQPLHPKCSQHLFIRSSPFSSTAARPFKLLSALRLVPIFSPPAAPENPRSPGRQPSSQQYLLG